MGWEGWFTIGSVVVMFALLALTRIGPEFILIGILTVLTTIGILTPDQAVIGMKNQGMITVAILYAVARAISETGAIRLVTPFFATKPKTIARAQLRMMIPVTALSAFLNNTPVVAIFIPAVAAWAKRCSFPVSKLMIPLSYAAIFGGTCTLIGTSTNLVVNGLYMDKTGSPSIGMFEITKVGVPCAVIMFLFVSLFNRWLLPDRSSAIEKLENIKEYTLEMIVKAGGRLVGKTIAQSGLTASSQMYLVEIFRDGECLPAVEHTIKLREEDRLVFAGEVEAMAYLQNIDGLEPAMKRDYNIDAPIHERCLVEVVVSNSCRLIGRTILGGHFRQMYNAAVIAVSRSGQKLTSPIGDIVINAGDTLLLETTSSFYVRHRNSRDFYLVSQLEDSTPINHKKAFLAFGILIVMVVLASTDVMGMLNAAVLATAALLITRCITPAQAMRSIDWQVLFVIIAAFGIGEAMQVTGAAKAIATSLISLVEGNPWLVLAVIYGCTSFFTEIITNNAGALLMFPIALSTAQQMNVSVMPFMIAVMMGASACFATPIGYQTNMMVFGPGGYRFSDFLRIGIPMNLLMLLVASLLIPLIWSF